MANASKWTTADWNDKSCNGISADGTHVTIRNNTLRNVNFGISVSATHSLIEHNTIENFSGDGMRGLGDYCVFQYNTVKNCYNVNANHDDGFQSWSVGKDGKVGTGEVTGIVLRGNRIINYEDPKQPFRGPLQGFGLFDGTFVDWVIENNVIITDHWHGITLLGAKNCRIVNNTVIDANTVKPGPPWIRIDKHKNGTPPRGCVVRNNLATAFASAKTGVVEDHNITVKSLSTYFVNPATHDLHLLATSPAIDVGSPTLAPNMDIERTLRPQGKAVDVGAYEWSSAPPKADAATTLDASVAEGGLLSDAPRSEGGSLDRDGAPVDHGASNDMLNGLGELSSDQAPPTLNDGGCACRVDEAFPPADLTLLLLALFVVFHRRITA